MKCSIKKTDILTMLANIQGITGKKSSLAITENILIKTINKGISVSATDIETGFEGIYPATVQTDGEIAVNARDFFDIVKKSGKEKIYISENKKQWIEITDSKDAGSLKYNIVGANTLEFPELPKIKDVSYFEIEADVFKKMISWAVMVMYSGDEKRVHILGADLECQETDDGYKLMMISTDGKRLTKTETIIKNKNNKGIESGQQIIIPKKALNEVQKFLYDKGKIGVGVKENYFIVKKDNEIIYINLFSGNFPDLKGLFVDQDRMVLEIDKKEFKDMLERMSILTSDDYKGVIFRFENNKLTVNAANPERGESSEFMNISFDKKAIETMFNPHYFIDALNVIDESKVYLKIKDEQTPCIICGKDSETNFNIIMPMKI
ncbi:MAG: DNA polymerase III subunit beta [Thermodesulfobacteriota bacterium]